MNNKNVDYRKLCKTNGSFMYGTHFPATMDSRLSQLFDGTNLKYRNFSNVLRERKLRIYTAYNGCIRKASLLVSPLHSRFH